MKKIKNIYFLFLSAGVFIYSSCNDKKEKECCKKHDYATEVSDGLAPKQSKESIYQLDGQWVNQNNQAINLTEFKGKIQIVAMIFTNCANACPRIVADMQLIESKIPLAQKDNVNFLLISFDTERDTPDRLTAFAKEKQLNKNWTLLHGEEELVREMALVLGIKYDKQTDGSFAHSNIITTLDSNGMIVTQQEGLGTSPEKTVETINNLLKSLASIQ